MIPHIFQALGLLALFAVAGETPTARAAEPVGFDDTVVPFFKSYCLRCHDDKQQKGDFRLDTLSRDFSEAGGGPALGRSAVPVERGRDATEEGTAAEGRGTREGRRWISTRIREGEAARMAKRGPVAHYRLSREEYGHTVYDLLGVYFDVNTARRVQRRPALARLRPHRVAALALAVARGPLFQSRGNGRGAGIPGPAARPRRRAGARPTPGRRAGSRQQGLAGPVRWLFWPGHGQHAVQCASPGTLPDPDSAQRCALVQGPLTASGALARRPQTLRRRPGRVHPRRQARRSSRSKPSSRKAGSRS